MLQVAPRSTIAEHAITTSEVVRALELAKASHLTSDDLSGSVLCLWVLSWYDSPEWVLNPIRMSAHSMTGTLSFDDAADQYHAEY